MMELLYIPEGTHRFFGFYGKGVGNQIPVKCYEDIKNQVEKYLGLYNLAISVSTYKDGIPQLLFLPFDFDADKLIDAWRDAKMLYTYFKNEGYTTYLTYTGRKGFHVMVKTKPKLYSRKHVRNIQKLHKDNLNLSTLDEQIFGDIRRLMRIPFTYNMNGNLCKIIAKFKGKELDLDDIYQPTEKEIEIEHNVEGTFHDYPCIESIVRDDMEPRHLIRFTYVILRLSEGWSYDEILDEMESFGWVDFNSDYCQKQIEHIDGRGYVPPSCNTLKELGYCVVENCPHRKDMGNMLKEVGIK